MCSKNVDPGGDEMTTIKYVIESFSRVSADGLTSTLGKLVAGSSGVAVLGFITEEKVITWAGVFSSVAMGLVVLGISIANKIDDRKREQKWKEFILKWKISQIQMGRHAKALENATDEEIEEFFTKELNKPSTST